MTQANLFDPPVRGHRPTRSDAVKNREAGHVAGSHYKANLYRRMLMSYGLADRTDSEMAELMQVQRSTINARRNELMAMGKVEEKGSKKNLATGVMNTLFGLKQG